MSVDHREKFMTSYFSLLPHELQNKIFCEHAKITFPTPAYTRGSFVKYTKEYHEQNMDESTIEGNIHIENMQDGLWSILLVKENPEWCSHNKQYIYKYEFEFGGICEGVALEEDLELVY